MCAALKRPKKKLLATPTKSGVSQTAAVYAHVFFVFTLVPALSLSLINRRDSAAFVQSARASC